MSEHHWVELSGTTETCSKCGLSRVALDDRGRWCSLRERASWEFWPGHNPKRRTKTEPKCKES